MDNLFTSGELELAVQLAISGAEASHGRTSGRGPLGFSVSVAHVGSWARLDCTMPRADGGSSHRVHAIDLTNATWPADLRDVVGGWTALAICEEDRRAAIGSMSEPSWALSTHPASAAVLASLDRPVSAVVRMLQRRRHPVTFDGENLTDVRLRMQQGVLEVLRATIISDAGDIAATLVTHCGTVMLHAEASLPETLATAMVGRTGGELCSLFNLDARSAAARIERVTRSRSRCSFVFEDAMVPVCPMASGGETWRPTSAVAAHRARWPASPKANEHLFRWAHAEALCRHRRSSASTLANQMWTGRNPALAHRMWNGAYATSG